MERTTVMLPNDLKIKASQFAGKKGISLGQLIRDALEESIKTAADNENMDDPLFCDNAVFSGETPKDMAKNHDDYLY